MPDEYPTAASEPDAPATRSEAVGPFHPPPGWAPAWPEYENLTPIGEGGMGLVYKARHVKLNRFEAVKVIRSGRIANPRDLERFRFEAEATASLEHPNIVPVYAVGEIDGLPYFAMKWVDGGELAGRDFRHDPKGAAGILAKVARAVHHAHRQGILHRDLKPSNILLDAAGEPHVTDFGLAKPVGDLKATPRYVSTVTGIAIGTPHYMAPEQARGDKGMTTAADVYGLGAILYELLTGRPPFTGGHIAEVMQKVVTEPPVAPRQVNPHANLDLEAVCLRCLEKDPQNRYPSAEAVADDLDRFLAGRPVSVRPTGVGDWLKQVLRRKPEPRQGYAWEVKLWFGAIMAVAQPTIFGLAVADAALGWVWATYLAAWAAGAAVIHRHMGQKFTRLPETEKHSMMIAVGHVLANVALTFAYVPLSWTARAAEALDVYPAQAVASGLSLFVVGTTHWGRFFLIGLGVMAVAPLLAAWPLAAPLVYGAVLAGCMWYWAYAVKVVFGVAEE